MLKTFYKTTKTLGDRRMRHIILLIYLFKLLLEQYLEFAFEHYYVIHVIDYLIGKSLWYVF